jgi:hypothetical protein
MEKQIYREAAAKLWHQGSPLTKKELESLAKLLDTASNSILINVGPTRLKAYLLAYRLNEVIKNAKSYEDLRSLLNTVARPPELPGKGTEWTNTAVLNQIAKLTGVRPNDLADRLTLEFLEQYQYSEITWHMANMQNKIRHEMIESVMNRESPLQLARRLHRTFDTYDYDMRRVAITETTRARNKGSLNVLKGEDPRGDDALVYFMVAKDACKDCKRLYLYPDGTPRLFRIKDIENVSNKGVPRAQWRAGLLIHPNDRCYPVPYNSQLEEWKKKWSARVQGEGGTVINKGLDNDPVRKVRQINGIKIAIEWPKGTVRTYEDCDIATKMKADYGYIKGTESPHDKMDLDCYVGPHNDSTKVFRLSQVKKGGKFDEFKYMLGYRSADEAKRSFLKHMPDWMYGSIEEITQEQFEHDIVTNLKAPEIGKGIPGERAGHKYIRRERDMKTGKWTYYYKDESGKVYAGKEEDAPKWGRKGYTIPPEYAKVLSNTKARKDFMKKHSTPEAMAEAIVQMMRDYPDTRLVANALSKEYPADKWEEIMKLAMEKTRRIGENETEDGADATKSEDTMKENRRLVEGNLYHGTRNKTAVVKDGFDTKHAPPYWDPKGIFLTPDESYAKEYGDVLSVKIKIKPEEILNYHHTPIARLKTDEAQYAAIFKDIRRRAKGRGVEIPEPTEKEREDYEDMTGEKLPDPLFVARIQADVLQKLGYKAMVYGYNKSKEDSVVVFDPKDMEIQGIEKGGEK